VADIGLATLVAESPWNDDAPGLLIRLGEAHAERPAAMTGGVYSLAALSVPGWTSDAARPVPRPPVTGRILEGQVAAVEAMTSVFADLDSAVGGSGARHALAAYLGQDVAPLLRASASPRLRRRLFAATTQLSYLCGFMCFDDQAHGLAQRYYRVALQLAAENGDQRSYAITMRELSVQALVLGHPRHSVHLAETAATMSRALPQRQQAFLFGQLAVAHAAGGDKLNALTTLTAAERSFDRASSGAGEPAIGAYHYASLAHQEASVRALLGDRKGAVGALSDSVRHRPLTERRSRAITLAQLAELHLGLGHLDEAVTTWNTFLDEYPALRSRRAADALVNLKASARSYTGHPAAKLLLGRATRLRAAARE
jgi:tetratricopeptide (TPR) repeat protein